MVILKETKRNRFFFFNLFLGSGNSPNNSLLLDSFKRACSSEIIIVVSSTCLKGKVILEHYGAGKQLYDIGLIGSGDMTVEAAYTKLCYLIGCGYDNNKIKSLFSQNLRGEITTEKYNHDSLLII